jgi:hypothetical protein
METQGVQIAFEQIGKGFMALAEAFEDDENQESIPAAKLGGKRRGRPKKLAKAASEDEDLEIDEEEDADEELEEEDADEEDLEEDEEEDADETVTPLELKNLKAALTKYAKKNGKPKAVKILTKFAKTSKDVKRKDFAKLLKLLKV